MNEWCAYFEKGVGCTIYSHRPKECADFSCLWLLGMIPGNLKPSKTGVVAHIDEAKGLLLHEDTFADALIAFKDPIEIWRSNGSDIGIIKFGDVTQ
jgi:hypothetical protein